MSVTVVRLALALQDASDKRVLRFAQRWGYLNLCSHGHPVGVCCPAPRVEQLERPEDWRTWARRFAALLDLAQRLDEAAPWDRHSVEAAFDWLPELGARAADVLAAPSTLPRGLRVALRDSAGRLVAQPKWNARSADSRRSYLVRALNRLLLASRVRSEVVIVRGGWALVDGSRWLFGALVSQLVQECVGVASWKICIECRSGFRADRRTGKFCLRCRRNGVPLKRAQQARRDRLRARRRTSRGRRLPRA